MAQHEPDPVQSITPTSTETAVPSPTSGKRRRAKIITVHGTFDNHATWDNWDTDAADAAKLAAGKPRKFMNRLREHLDKSGLVFDREDHTEYNWSGRNSHDERLVSAIGLKKAIQEDLEKAYDKHGHDYYDGGVHVIGHSHGGTISRLAMNLWNKDDDYYGAERPSDAPGSLSTFDELQHDDHCWHCLQQRNGAVGPNTVPRPDRVITMGSPFVTFDERKGGLLAANMAVWSYRVLTTAPLLIYFAIMTLQHFIPDLDIFKTLRDVLVDPVDGSPFLRRPGVEIALLLLVPLALYWVLASYAPRRFALFVESWAGKGTLSNATAVGARLVSFVGLAALGVYYVAYFLGGKDGIEVALALMDLPIVTRSAWWVIPLVLYWLFAISLPGRSLSGLGKEVAKLRAKLPKKYDPRDETQVPFVSYLTPGDEPGLGLRLQGLVTWLIQTLFLSTTYVLAVGLFLAIVAGVETLMSTTVMGGRGILAPLGLSPNEEGQQGRFIALMDGLTALPGAAWNALASLPGLSSWLGGPTQFGLAGVAPSAVIAPYVPASLVGAFMSLLFGLMPSFLVALAIAFAVSLWLRNSLAGFGAERFAWTLANRIAVSRRANANSMLRTINFTPEAWFKKFRIAHCYYYDSDTVTKDIAHVIANQAQHKADPLSWPIGQIVARTSRAVVVLLCTLSLFAIASQRAKAKYAAAMNPPAAKTQKTFEAGYPFQDCLERCPVMVVLPPGEFWMGSSQADGNQTERPRHHVTIAYRLAVSKTEVTFAQWDACVEGGGCNGHRPVDQFKETMERSVRPVVNVSWHDATAYVKWLSAKTGDKYRLLSEAEWEYAARAGNRTKYSWGDDVGTANANCKGCGSLWDGVPAPVGSFKPNAFGLHDMHGNVAEWVDDPMHADYIKAPADGSVWLEGGNAERRMVRGGSTAAMPEHLRSANRGGPPSDTRSSELGFRVAREIEP